MRNAEKQPEAFAFGTGMDQSFGDRSAPPGTLTLVKNCRIATNGSLVKRCGSSAIAAGGAATNWPRDWIADTATVARPTEKAAFIGRLVDQKIAGNSAGSAFVYGGTKWAFLGCTSAAQPVRKRLGLSPALPTQPVGPYAPAVAVTSDGYVCTAAGFGPEIKIAVESPTGELLYAFPETVGAASIIVHVVCVGSTFYVCYQGSASATVSVRTLTVSSGLVTVGTTGTLVTLNNAGATWDTSNYDGTNWFLIYMSAATTVTLAKMAGTTASATATFATTDFRNYLSVWADPVTDRVWVGSVDDPTGTPVGSFRIYTDTPTLSVGPTSFAATPVGPPLFGPLYTRTPVAGDAFCVFADSAASPTRSLLVAATIQAGALTREVTQSFNVIPISKPDVQQRVWCMTHAISKFETTFADGSSAVGDIGLERVMLLRFVGAEMIGQATSDPTPVVELSSPVMESLGNTYHLSNQRTRAFQAVAVTTESAGGSTFFALPFVLTSRTNASGVTEPLTRVDVYEYTRYNQEPHRQMLPLGRSAAVSGQPVELWGTPTHISAGRSDAGGAVEFGFAQGPSIVACNLTADAGGVAVGSYLYQTVQEYTDDEGNRHLSPASPLCTVTIATPSIVDLQITNCYVGQRPNIRRAIATRSPRTIVYRTQNGGTDAQLVPINTAEPAADWSGYVTATDTVTDSIVDDNEFIYTAGGVLANVLAPSCRYLAASEDRLWCGGLWDSNIIECSKTRFPGLPYEFTNHPSHQVVIPGEVSGLAYMDGQVVAFTEDAIYLVSGDGPNDQGAGGFAPPRALVRGVGCPRTQSASILETEIGIVFRSAMGFYLIPRGFGSPQYVGDKVQDEDGFVLSAATSTTTDFRLARWLVCASGETKGDTVLTLDLTNMQWFRDEYTVNGSITGQGFSEIGEWPDGLALMSYGLDRADNPTVIWAESEALTGDAGATGAGASTYIPMYARTGWIYLWGPLGIGRLTEVVLSMEAIGSSSVVTLSVEADGNTAQSPFWTITTSEAVSYRAASPAQPECTCFRVTVSDAAGASNSAGVRLLALGFETTSPGGLRRVTDSERQ